MDVQHQMLPMNIIIMTMLIMMNMLMLMKMSLLVAPVKGAVETMLPLTLGQLLLLEVFDGFHDVEVNGIKERAVRDAALVYCTSAGSDCC